MINTAPNSPWKGYLPNVNPFGVSPRYTPGSLSSLYSKVMSERQNDMSTDSIKAVDREDANIEAEKDEVLLTFKPYGSALHKIQGKPHSKGGTPLNVEEGSFIFSKDKSLALSKEEIEEYELGSYLKGGGVKNSPANVLKRNVDIKHNNKMIDLLENSKNYAEKNTAMRMLKKYHDKIGTIAALQELRKNEQLPEFAQLPMKNPLLEQEEVRQEQYSHGGWVLPRAQFGVQIKPKSYITKQDLLYKPFNPASIQESLNAQIQTPSVVEPKLTPLQKAAQRLSQSYQNIQGTPEYEASEDLDISDDLSWIKPYDMTPTVLSMVGNAMQSPRSFYPSLPLQEAAQLREQTFNAQPGVNAALASAYASRKALNQYLPQSLQNMQALDAQATSSAQNYANQVERMNQANKAQVHNQNVQTRNAVLNANNLSRAQYRDKLNELYQNVSDTRNAIAAQNLQLYGNARQEKQKYDMTVDYMKRFQPWNVEQKMSQKNLQQVVNEFNDIKNANPDMSEVEKVYLLKMMMGRYQKSPQNMDMLYYMMSGLQ